MYWKHNYSTSVIFLKIKNDFNCKYEARWLGHWKVKSNEMYQVNKNDIRIICITILGSNV